MDSRVDQFLFELGRGGIALAVGQTGAAGQLLHFGEGNVHLGRVDVGTAAALEVGILGRAADHGDVTRVAQGQHPVVLEQHNAFPGDPARQGVVFRQGGLHGLRTLPAFGGGGGLEDDIQNTAHGFVQQRFVQFATAHGRDHRLHPAVAGAGHFQVQTALQRLHPVMDGAPVGHHQTLEAPLAFEDVHQQFVVFGAIGAVELVVRAHHRPRPRLFHCRLEGRQVKLAQRALVDPGVDTEAFALLVVGGEVLQGGADALALHAVDVAGCQLAGQIGVFGKILKIAPAEGRALHVYPGAEHHIDPQGNGFFRQRLPQLAHQLHIPGGGQTGGRGEAGGWQALRAHGVDIRDMAHPVGAVGHEQLWHAQAGHRRRRPHAGARAERRLLFQGHLLDDGLQLFHLIAAD